MSKPNMLMSSDDWNKLKHLVDLSAENARLKDEVERLKHKLGRLLGAEQEWELVEPGEYVRLKDEVERLRASSFVTAVPVEEYEKLKAEVERLTNCKSEADRLKAEVERLRKAGDVLSHCIASNLGDDHIIVRVWNAAKEGKQP